MLMSSDLERDCLLKVLFHDIYDLFLEYCFVSILRALK